MIHQRHVPVSLVAVLLLVTVFGPWMLIVAEEGEEPPVIDQQYGGQDIAVGEFLWFTAIIQTQGFRFRCSGALVGPRHVVTASHCVDNAISTLVEVGYWCRFRGNCGRKSEQIGIRTLFRHETSTGEPGGDMVLIELNRAVSFPVTPAIPYLGPLRHPNQTSLETMMGQKLVMVGAGRGGTKSNITDFVTKLEVEGLPTEECKRRVSPSLVTEFTVCSTVPSDDGAPCRGDSGSALVVPGRGQWQHRDVVLALHNQGPKRCSDGREGQAFLHFRMEEAADLLQSIVCEDDDPADWCDGTSMMMLPAGPEDCSENHYYDEDSKACLEVPSCAKRKDNRVFDAFKQRCVKCRNNNGQSYDSRVFRCIRVCPKDPQIAYRPNTDLCVCTKDNFKYKTTTARCVCQKGFMEDDGECIRKCPEDPHIEYRLKTDQCVCTKDNFKFQNSTKSCVCQKGFMEVDGECIRECPEDPQIEYRPERDRCVCTKDNFKFQRSTESCVCQKGFMEVDGECVSETRL